MSNCANDDAPNATVVWLDDTGSGRADPPVERVLSLGNVARMFGVSKLALRGYELRGLIKRSHSLHGTRVYGWADCERLAFIIKCRRAGVVLSEIVTIIQASEDDVSPLQFKTGQGICTTLMERLERRRRVVDEALSELRHVHALLTTKLVGDAKPGRN
jgi:DNA-binding transcriptional MerR regulator